ncbi:MAG: esterase family protein [Lentisphaerae bacterium]|nr:esterase family protein [Lentisphaerota bacterium]
MALLNCNFFSETLGMPTNLDIILPQPCDTGAGPAAQPRKHGFPCLLLLHGRSDDHTAWQRRTSIERYAAPLGLAVVMPNVHRSFYADMDRGYRYWALITEELPAILQRFFRLSIRREDNFVAGLSMGGYGAFKLALHHPERFAAAASLSGALDIAGRDAQETLAKDGDWRLVFGDAPLAGTGHDLLACAERLAASGRPSPKLYQWCGQQDFLYSENIAFRDTAQRLRLPLTYEESPGDHNWGCWDLKIQDVLKWLPLPA